jgi:hypothetical protein
MRTIPALSTGLTTRKRGKICLKLIKLESEMYHNSTESTGPALKAYQDKANTQEDRIMYFLKADPVRPITPSAALKWIFSGSVPITSVRRALTNLTNDGHIVKTTTQTKGPYGRPEFVWELAGKYNQREMF